MKIGKFDSEKEVLIVAEIGNNHEGRYELAQKLVQKAAECGVDAVKFQTFDTKFYVSQKDEARYHQLRSFELNISQFKELSDLAHSLGLLFFSTPFDLESVRLLKEIVDAYKIASGDSNFYPLLESIAQISKPIILSTGLSDFQQILRSVQFIEEVRRKSSLPAQLALLHCVTAYPASPEEVNLHSIPFLRENFKCPVGYSDHTIGTDACVAATALGACIIEKHFTLDKAFSSFRDHQLSADPAELKQLVQRVQLVSSMLGEFQKAIQPSEKILSPFIRRSIVAAGKLAKGHQISSSDLT